MDDIPDPVNSEAVVQGMMVSSHDSTTHSNDVTAEDKTGKDAKEQRHSKTEYVKSETDNNSDHDIPDVVNSEDNEKGTDLHTLKVEAVKSEKPEVVKSEDVENSPEPTTATKENMSEDTNESATREDESKESNNNNCNKGAKKNKKRKKDKTTKTSDTNDGICEESKAKKPRVKPEKAREVYNKMLEELAKNYKIGMTETPFETLVATLGYKHVRSDAILAAKKLMKAGEMGTVNGKTCKLTEKGIEELVPDMKPAKNPEEAMAQFWNHLEMKLSMEQKTKNDKAKTSARAIFDKLADGKGYTKKELLKLTHYGMERSTGFPETFKAMKDLEFTQQNGQKVSFTDKLFPFGRP